MSQNGDSVSNSFSDCTSIVRGIDLETGSVESTPDLGGKHARFNIEKVSLENRLSPTLEHYIHHDMDTIGYATHEAVPLTVFYRNETSVDGKAKMRPTLAALHQGFDELDEHQEYNPEQVTEEEVEPGKDPKVVSSPATSKKFGWIQGVLIPCLLNIWGVILYLRLPWLTGQAGILMMSVIILLSSFVTVITTLSMSAICTNGEVKGGGAYYLISRSLGPEFGGSIGIIFSLANAVGVALYVVGFAEVLQLLMQRTDAVMVDKLNDIRIIGCIVVVLLLMLTLIGLDWVIRTQIILLAILLLSIFDYILGTFTGSLLTDLKVLQAQGFTSYSTETFSENLFPEYRNESFFSIFSIFFPAATGILAGVNISGDLKDPQYAVPKGTLVAICLTTVVYILLVWIIGATTLKDAAGVLSVAVNTSGLLSNMSSNTEAPLYHGVCISRCKYGLLHDSQIMERISLVGPLVLAGTFAATLSSALASLVGSPKTFQVVCKDRIFQGLSFFSKGFGPNDEPRRAYVLTFFIAVSFILIGEIDDIAPIISNFFLMSYALINYSVFASSLARSPGWRPAFKYYNMWLSLLGCIVCVAIMFLINWWAALVTIALVMALYKYVDYKKPEINWGSSGQAHMYMKAMNLAYQLNQTNVHVKNFRPQCLVVSGSPSIRPNLVQFVSHLTKHVGLMICGQVVVKNDCSSVPLNTVNQEKWLKQKHIKSFMSVVAATSLREGIQALMQSCGLGKLRPNIAVFGFKHDWKNISAVDVDEYINIIYDCFNSQMNVAILRMPNDGVIAEDSDNDDLEEDSVMESKDESLMRKQPKKPPFILTMECKMKGTIDVWWLFDDGGLTMLLPYLLSRNKCWKNCKLRVFTPATEKKKLKSNQIRMANLLKKFRIKFSEVIEVHGINSRPSQENIDVFNKLGSVHRSPSTLDKKTLRQIRLNELVRENSSQAKLVVLTMPVPRKTVVTSLMYMSWLEVISQDLDVPVLLVRGNQTNVLTFYC